MDQCISTVFGFIFRIFFVSVRSPKGTHTISCFTVLMRSPKGTHIITCYFIFVQSPKGTYTLFIIFRFFCDFWITMPVTQPPKGAYETGVAYLLSLSAPVATVALFLKDLIVGCHGGPTTLKSMFGDLAV